MIVFLISLAGVYLGIIGLVELISFIRRKFKSRYYYEDGEWHEA